MIELGGIKNWFPKSINRFQKFSPLFLSLICFSDFCNNKKIFVRRIKTQKVLQNWGSVLSVYFL